MEERMPADRTPAKLSVDFSGVEVRKGGRTDHIPEGDYLVQVMKVVERGKKADPTVRMLNWHFQVVEPAKFKGKNIFNNTLLAKENLWALRSLLVDLLGGEDKVPASKVSIPLETITAKKMRVGITVVDDEYNNKPTSKIVGTFPKAEWEERKTTATSDDIEDDDEDEEDTSDPKEAATASDDDEDMDEIDIEDI
jgi:hypothetical protein